MIWIPALALGVLAAAGGYALTRKPKTATLHADPTTTYRLRLTTATEESGRALVLSLGFSPKTMLPNPSVKGEWTSVAQYTAFTPHDFTPAELKKPVGAVLDWSPVEEPPQLTVVDIPQLDRGMDSDTAAAVVYAMKHEKSPVRMNDFGESLQPDFPVAGGWLTAKARANGYKPPAKPPTPVVSATTTKSTSAKTVSATVVKKPAPLPVAQKTTSAAQRQTALSILNAK